MTILPNDCFNRAWRDQIHPADWVNPQSAKKYDLVVIGAGPAGLVTAAIAATLGAKVALIEKQGMGGDCLNVGCVPSKGVIAASRIWESVRRADTFGLIVPPGIKQEFSTVMARMRELRAQISHHDSAARFTQMGVDVFFGTGRFVRSGQIEIEGATLNFKKAAICTGARARAPFIPGLIEAGYKTNETIFELTKLPSKMAVIGAGPIGCEMAQAFARFGSEVTLFVKGDRLLPREDEDAAKIVEMQMKKDGVVFVFNTENTAVTTEGNRKLLHYEQDGVAKESVVDEILSGVGRAPNVEGLDLENAGVSYDNKRGVFVNSFLQTTNPSIYAAGDICSPFQFTHAADAMAAIVIQNALFPHPLGLGLASTDSLVIPWCTYTSPEIAHVGVYDSDPSAVDTFTCLLTDSDRAVLDGEEEGFVRVHLKKGTDQILGATVIATHAGEMIGEITLAMTAKLGLGTISKTIHPYPTQSETVRKVALQWRKSRFTEQKKKILTGWFSLTR
ncbi:MAG: mercuric reductase [Nitrospirota bacterium]